MSAFADVSVSFVREQLRAPLTLVLLVAIPVFFVLIFAGVLGDFATALGGTIAGQGATAITAGWAAAFLCGTLAFFQVASSRGSDRRLALAGLGATRVAISRIAAALLLGVIVSAVAFLTLLLRSGIQHPLHAAVAISRSRRSTSVSAPSSERSSPRPWRGLCWSCWCSRSTSSRAPR